MLIVTAGFEMVERYKPLPLILEYIPQERIVEHH